jgi:hypothetical protein
MKNKEGDGNKRTDQDLATRMKIGSSINHFRGVKYFLDQ